MLSWPCFLQVALPGPRPLAGPVSHRRHRLVDDNESLMRECHMTLELLRDEYLATKVALNEALQKLRDADDGAQQLRDEINGMKKDVEELLLKIAALEAEYKSSDRAGQRETEGAADLLLVTVQSACARLEARMAELKRVRITLLYERLIGRKPYLNILLRCARPSVLST